jgi:hypothetical protein
VAHKQPTLVRDECQPPAVAEFDRSFASSISPVRGRPRGNRRRDAIRFPPMFPVELAKLRRCAIHPGVDGPAEFARFISGARKKGKSDAPIEFAPDLPRRRSRYGRACMWLGAVCRPARQNLGTNDADRRGHAGRRSKGHRAGSVGHGARGRARAGGAGSKARPRSSPCTRGRTGTFGFNGPAHSANRRRAHQGGGPCSRKAASRAPR